MISPPNRCQAHDLVSSGSPHRSKTTNRIRHWLKSVACGEVGVGGGPADAEAWQQGGRHPDPFRAASAGRAAGHVRAVSIRDRDHARELPVLRAGTI